MTLTTGQRAAITTITGDLIAAKANIAYPKPSQVIRPHLYRTLEWLRGYWAKGHLSVWDCSIAVQQVFYCAQVASQQPITDPSGFNYEGWGDTQSWVDRLPHYTKPADAHAGALVVLGVGLPVQQQHGCIVIGTGRDPLLFSHGSDAGPIAIKLSQEQPAHPNGETVFLDVSSL